MQETETKITVSSINDISSFNLERIITVKGSIDNMSKAEAQISAKLRQSYENDLQAMAPQTMMFPGKNHPIPKVKQGLRHFKRVNAETSRAHTRKRRQLPNL